MAYYCTKRRKWYVDSMNKRICILHALQMAMMILRTHTPATYIFCFSNFFVQQLWQQLFTWSFYVLPVTTRLFWNVQRLQRCCSFQRIRCFLVFRRCRTRLMNKFHNSVQASHDESLSKPDIFFLSVEWHWVPYWYKPVHMYLYIAKVASWFLFFFKKNT